MSHIQELLSGRNNEIDYDEVIRKYHWIIEEKHNCILSPDSDGILCGLLMSHLLNWKIKGFYDGKVMVLEKGLSAKDCIFLDIEIFRKDIRSFGHHMLLFNKNNLPPNWDNFQNCLQPNNMRKYDGRHDFRLKYPLATIHMLLGMLSHKLKIEMSEDTIAPLFFVDGTFKVLFSYPENVLNWLKYLKVGNSPLKTIFMSEKYSVNGIMLEMDKFFRERDKISVPKERGDRLRISTSNGSPYNLITEESVFKINERAVERIKKFIKILSAFTTWKFKESDWRWNNFKLYRFSKSDFVGDKKNVNGQTFNDLMSKNPLSWAMTSGQNIEYTLEEPDKLP